MVRRAQQGQQKLRKAQREMAEQLESDQGSYKPPDREECSTRQWEMAGDDAYTIRVQTRIWRHDGRLVDFFIDLQVLTADGWESVEYIDCCHGQCHYHPRNSTARRSNLRLDVVDDVQNACSAAEPLIYERLRIIRG